MTTGVNPKSQRENILSDDELELLHMISFEYIEAEILREAGWPHDHLNLIRASLYKKLQVQSEVGLIRAAFEKKILILIHT